MAWKSPFIVYRISSDGQLQEVYRATDLKDAKYWLTYIAEPADVLCRTPAHPRHEDSAPKYWSHKSASGKANSDESEWRYMIQGVSEKGEITFPPDEVGTQENL